MIETPLSIIFLMFIIFGGATLFSTIALYTRQSILVAYILVGFIFGPYVLHVVPNLKIIDEIGEVGIIFLLFLIGMHLQPRRLLGLLNRAILVTVASCAVFGCVSYMVAYMYGFTHMESLIISLALIFSSTIIGLKLLPNNMLRYHRIGEVIVSILLLEDLIAILVLIFLNSAKGGIDWSDIVIVTLGLPTLIAVAFLLERLVLVKLFTKFERFKEYLFLLPIGWCLGLVVLSERLQLSAEVGAFIAGVTLAEHRIAEYITDSLKPLRDFFLIIFFFTIGASFNPSYLSVIIVPSLLLAAIIIVLKPATYRFFLTYRNNGTNSEAWQVGWRLGQASEFSLLVAFTAMHNNLISPEASYLIQAVTILSIVVSSYIVVVFYPTPIAFRETLRQD